MVPGAVCSVLALVFVIKKKTLVAGALLLVALFFAGEALADLDYPSPGGAGGTDAPAMALALQCCRRRSDSPNHPVRVMTAHRSDAMLATGAQVL